MMTSLECSTRARNRCSLARSRSAARLRSVMSRPTSTTWSRLMGEIAPENQTSRPRIDRLYSKWTVVRVSSAVRMYSMNWSACAPSNTSRNVLPSSSAAGRYSRDGLVGAILT